MLALMAFSAMAFSATPLTSRCAAAPRQSVSMSSGFGEKKIVGKSANPNQKPGVYEKLQKKIGGAPEYSIFIRNGEASEWRSAGVLIVPRTASVMEAVSKAIFTRETEMVAAIAKVYPDLGKVPAGELEFGFRSQEFEADPIELAKREFAADKKNFLQKFVEDLNNPINNEKD
ncbi:hypothetical protein T492DRAFT_989361 [Pavlovales sp. CCMP2436]|nr:hypothetical protein T492DRAFT_989361 [Pavlovales sp. CCMP2436]